METIGDLVLAHVKQYRTGNHGTSEGRAMLELPQEYEYNSAGNIYLAALCIIMGLQDKITRPDPLGEALNSGDGVYRP